MTALLLHPTSVSVSPSPFTTCTPLALPSRFPAAKRPYAAVSNGGNVYIYARHGPVVWEYDRSGRRISEMNLFTAVEDVVCLGANVGVRVGEGVKVMSRRGKKWESTRVLEAPPGAVRMEGKDNSLVVIGDEVWVYEVENGVKHVLDVATPVSCARIVNRDGLFLVVPSAEGVECIPLDHGRTDVVKLPGMEATDVAVSPSGVIAVASGSSVAVVSDDSVDTVAFDGDFDGHVESVAWVDNDTLLATVSQKLFVHNLKTGSTGPAAMDQPVVGVIPVPTRQKSTDRVLSDTHMPNNITEKRDDKVTQPDKENKVVCPNPTNAPKDKTDKANPRPRQRVVSNMGPPPLPLPKANTTAALPFKANAIRNIPLATPSNPMMARGTGTGTGDTLRLRPPMEEDEGIPSPATLPPTPGSGAPGPGWDAFEDMRTQIANLQLDMLRMGRGLKNEIRSAVAPLVDELRASREIIAVQAAEIERLRRGF